MFCGKCGSKIPDEIKYCPKCGRMQKNENTISLLNNDGNFFQNNIDRADLQELPIHSKTKSSILSRCISVFLCVIIFAFSVSIITIGSVRIVFNKENLKNISEKIDISEINLEYEDNSVNITDFIMKNISNQIIEQFNISDEKINKLLQNDTIRESMEDICSEYLCYVIYGDESEDLSVTGILNTIKSCSDIVHSETGYSFTDGDYQDIEKELTDGYMKFLVIDNIKTNSVINIHLINVLFSLPSLIIQILIFVGLIFLLLWCNKWQPKYLCAYVGITLVIVGTLYLLLAILSFIISILSEIYILKILLQSMLICISLFGAGTFIIGIVMFLLYRKVLK